MARGLNKAMIIGRLGQEPNVNYMPNGNAVCNISVATSQSWKDKTTGEQKESTEWHNVVFFNRLGEVAGQYLHKGSQVYVEGHLRTRKWQDKNGVDRYTTEIVAGELQMLGGRQGAASGSTESGSTATGQAQPAAGGYDEDDDIPF